MATADRSDARETRRAWRIVLLTCRDPATDFRLPLAEELQALGHEVAYVFLKRRPVVVELGARKIRREMSLPAFLRAAKGMFGPSDRLLVFNSTNLVFPGMSRLLRAICGGVWCLDLHDDLLYDRTGANLFKGKLALRALLGGSDLAVHAAPTLKERFPRSHHLGNASAVTPVDRPAPDFSRLLVLASLDARIDFAFLSRAASLNPGLTFDVFGQIAGGDPAIRAAMDDLTARHSNVAYHGAYVNDDLPGLLAAYAVTLAPYMEPSPLTRYIDPLRFYHCLNSGMEVLSTPIPKARDFGPALHLVTSPDEVGPLVERLRDEPASRRNSVPDAVANSWKARARRLTEIVEAACPDLAGRPVR